MNNLIGLRHALPGSLTGEPGQLFNYVTAANGVFISAGRPEFDASVPVMSPRSGVPLRGLASIAAGVVMARPRVPAQALSAFLAAAVRVCANRAEPTELLWWLRYAEGWKAHEPAQDATAGSVQPTESDWPQTCLEIHSHHEMAARFSAMDDEDERQGFKIYAVLGRIFTRPELRVRVGLYGYLYEIPARDVFELPAGIVDAREVENGD